MNNSEASEYHKHDPCCGQLDLRVLCPRVSNQISTAGWYRAALPPGDSGWERGKEKKGKGEKRFKHNKWRKTLTLSDMAFVIMFARSSAGERRWERKRGTEADRLMLSLVRLTWNRLISLGFPAVFKQF